MRRRSFRPIRMLPRAKPWYERNGGAILTKVQSIVGETYPDLSFQIDNEASRVSLEGTITLLSDSGVPAKISMRVTFPPAYPNQEPVAYDVENQFAHCADRHFYPDGQCCLWLPPESLWNADDPEALQHFLAQVAIFFDKQLIYEVLGTWPGPARSHGHEGYVEFIQELLGEDANYLTKFVPVFLKPSLIGRNTSCPCGQGMKFKKCHEYKIDEIRQRVGFVILRKVFLDWDKKQVQEKING